MQANKLKGKIREKNKTYAECSEGLGMSITAFSNKMNGISKFDVIEANALANLLEMTDSEKIDIFLS